MTRRANNAAPDAGQAVIALYGVVSGWSVALLIGGALNLSESWGLPLVVAGALCATGVVVAIWRTMPMIALFTGLLSTAGLLIAAGAATGSTSVAAAGGLGLIVSGAVAAVVWHLAQIGRSVTHSEGGQSEMIQQLLAQIHANSILSDNAKRVLFRDRELELLRNAISEDIGQGDYNAALTLCDELAELFGQREEAEDFRAQIMQARREHYEAQVHAALDQFDALLEARDWGRVHQEAARLRRLYTDSHLIQDLDERIHVARESHKRQLDAEFRAAVEREDVGAAMTLLHALDKYLSREEGEALAPLAQQVVAQYREQLGDQFKMAVSQRRWADAAQVGDVIMQKYPNTKMADEVRSMIDVLRMRATEAAVAAEQVR